MVSRHSRRSQHSTKNELTTEPNKTYHFIWISGTEALGVPENRGINPSMSESLLLLIRIYGVEISISFGTIWNYTEYRVQTLLRARTHRQTPPTKLLYFLFALVLVRVRLQASQFTHRPNRKDRFVFFSRGSANNFSRHRYGCCWCCGCYFQLLFILTIPSHESSLVAARRCSMCFLATTYMHVQNDINNNKSLIWFFCWGIGRHCVSKSTDNVSSSTMVVWHCGNYAVAECNKRGKLGST